MTLVEAILDEMDFWRGLRSADNELEHFERACANLQVSKEEALEALVQSVKSSRE